MEQVKHQSIPEAESASNHDREERLDSKTDTSNQMVLAKDHQAARKAKPITI